MAKHAIFKYLRIVLRALFVTYSINSLYLALDVVYSEMRQLLMARGTSDAANLQLLADMLDPEGESVKNALGMQTSATGHIAHHDLWNGDGSSFRALIAEFLRGGTIKRQIDSVSETVQLPRFTDREMTENPGGGLNNLWGIARGLVPPTALHFGNQGVSDHIINLKNHLKKNWTCDNFTFDDKGMPFKFDYEGQSCPMQFPSLFTAHEQAQVITEMSKLPWSQDGGLIQPDQTEMTLGLNGDVTESMRVNLIDLNIFEVIKARHLADYKNLCRKVVEPEKESITFCWTVYPFENPVRAFDKWRPNSAQPVQDNTYMCEYGKYTSSHTMYRFANTESGVVGIEYTFDAQINLTFVMQPVIFGKEFKKLYPFEGLIDAHHFGTEMALALDIKSIYAIPTEIMISNQKQYVLLPKVGNYDMTMKIFSIVLFLISSYVGIHADSLFMLLYLMTESAVGFLLINAGSFLMWGSNSKFYALIITLFGGRGNHGAVLNNFWPLGDFKKMNVIFLIVLLKASLAMVLSTVRGVKQAGVFDKTLDSDTSRLASIPGVRRVLGSGKKKTKVVASNDDQNPGLDDPNAETSFEIRPSQVEHAQLDTLPPVLNVRSSVLVSVSFILTLAGVTLQPLIHDCKTPDTCLIEAGTVVFLDAILYLFIIFLVNFTFAADGTVNVSNCLIVHKQRLWFYPVAPEMIGVNLGHLSTKIKHASLVAMSESAIQMSLFFNFIFRSLPAKDIKLPEGDEGVDVYEIVDGCSRRSTVPSSFIQNPEFIHERPHWGFISPTLQQVRKYHKNE